MACVFYLFAKNDPIEYEKLVKELHRTGKATHKNYTIEPNKDALEMYDVNPQTSQEHPSIPDIDWITMAVTRSKESDIGYTGKRRQDASAINWPWIMTSLGEKLLGYTIVETDYYKINKSYLRDFFGSDEKVRILEKDINEDYNNGYEICMMIDGDMVERENLRGDNYSFSDFEEYHWVVYEGGLELLNETNESETDYDKVTTINFNVYTWGELRRGDVNKITLKKDQFIANYYGYIKLK